MNYSTTNETDYSICSQECRKAIKRRVAIIFIWRKLSQPIVLESIAFAGAGASFYFSCSVSDVIRNMPSFLNIHQLFDFSTSAFINAEVTVQLFFAGGVLVSFFLFRDIKKKIFPNNNSTNLKSLQI